MSADIVDDLDAAEDALGDMVATARYVLEQWDGDPGVRGIASPRFTDAVAQLRARVATYDQRCRPTCRADGEGRDACQDEDPECCGCPCHADD